MHIPLSLQDRPSLAFSRNIWSRAGEHSIQNLVSLGAAACLRACWALGQNSEQRRTGLPSVEGVAEEADLRGSSSWFWAFALMSCICQMHLLLPTPPPRWALSPGLDRSLWTPFFPYARPLAWHCAHGRASVHSGRTCSN